LTVSWAIHGGWPARCPTGESLPPNIAQVNPPDGAQVSRASSVCVDLLNQADDVLGKNPWERARFYMDGVNVASKLRGGLLNIGEDSSPMCYEVYWSLPVGWHTAQVIYGDIKGQKFQYTWRFQVKD
jgi:hypothetical protein